ncbi:type II secretion system GspH family protein [Ligilactobacillus sp. WILCCON 0076]|uniref:Type II secretion system GspH family protein n=1 Tax=Ligilactobacillus ubinensis TaxID=2876789 RepID=A0A9X2FIZ6_9LACO|nr:type II secretion system protein [Ligilactobacillus ubinensis]MCP0886269.1 type II secretion system GspH family protein [Ligilactobacillus ubinensis]
MKYKNKKAAFTLLETLIALVISAIGILLVTGIIFNISKNLEKQKQEYKARVVQMVQVIESDTLMLEYRESNYKGSEISFYSATKKSMYNLKFQNNKIWLNQDGQGYMPLLFEVESFKSNWNNNKHSLNINIKMHGYEFNRTVILATYKGKVDDE